jgi:ADP-ribose pyrophosphatase
MDLTEHCLHSDILARGDLLTVKKDRVKLPNGNVSQREYVMHPGAVVIVPILPNRNILLERQFRYPLHQVFIELPAGKIDPNEDVLHTAQRELLEETGYSAEDWVKLGIQHPCIGYSNEVIHIFLAQNLSAGQHKRDEDELLEVFESSLDDCLRMMMQGEITDSKTICALFMTKQHLVG